MNKTKQKDVKEIGILLGILVLLNCIAVLYYYRLDLTEDKRFSLSEPTKKLLSSLNKDLEVEVYLKGDFPARFEKIEKAVEDKLKEMRRSAKGKLRFRFIDPMAIENDSIKKYTLQRLTQMGIEPMLITEAGDGAQTENYIFPGAVITYGGKQFPVNLVKGNANLDLNDDLRISQSISLLEYELANGIKILANGRRKRIAFIRGHGESTGKQLLDAGREFTKFSDVSFLELNGVRSIDSMLLYDLIIVVKPVKAYTEEDKYKLDQFVMHGGNLSFFLDMIDLRPDSSNMTKIIGVPRELELTDLLFTYGARVNQTIIQDMQGSEIPIEVSKGNYQRSINDFSPIITTYSKHPSVKYGKPVLFQDCSTVDTIRAEGIKKTPLMYTSQYTKVNGGQIYFPIKDFMQQHNRNYYPEINLPVTYLLEGNFTSNFNFKPVPKGFDRTKKLKKGIKPAKIIVCSDGDFISNGVNPTNGNPMPLGINQFNKSQQFANLEVVTALVDYQLGDADINSLRIKDIQKRPLDKIKINEEKVFWQVLNLGLPIILILIIGGLVFFVRRYKYTRF